jgi:hypothetical protein
MAWEPKEGSGSLFKAEQKSEKAPGYRGEILLGGVLYELAGWIKEGKSGKFFSLSGKPKGETYKNGLRQEAPKDSIADMADDIPF